MKIGPVGMSCLSFGTKMNSMDKDTFREFGRNPEAMKNALGLNTYAKDDMYGESRNATLSVSKNPAQNTYHVYMTIKDDDYSQKQDACVETEDLGKVDLKSLLNSANKDFTNEKAKIGTRDMFNSIYAPEEEK
jgi:hypothetical protein